MVQIRARKPRDLSAALVAARRGRGWSQAELADRIGVGRDYVGDLESGQFGLQVTRLMRLLGELRVDEHVLFPHHRGVDGRLCGGILYAGADRPAAGFRHLAHDFYAAVDEVCDVTGPVQPVSACLDRSSRHRDGLHQARWRAAWALHGVCRCAAGLRRVVS